MNLDIRWGFTKFWTYANLSEPMILAGIIVILKNKPSQVLTHPSHGKS